MKKSCTKDEKFEKKGWILNEKLKFKKVIEWMKKLRK